MSTSPSSRSRLYACAARASPRAEERAAKAGAAGGRVHVALEARRVVRLDLQHDKGGAVSLAQHAAAVREFGFARDRAGARDAGAGGGRFAVDAAAGLARLVTGLAVMAVLDAEDPGIRRGPH